MAWFKREVLVVMLAAPPALMVEPWTVMSAGRGGELFVLLAVLPLAAFGLPFVWR